MLQVVQQAAHVKQIPFSKIKVNEAGKALQTMVNILWES